MRALLLVLYVVFAGASSVHAQEAINSAEVTPPAGITDPTPANDQATDSDFINRTLTVRKVVLPAGDAGQFVMNANGTSGTAGGSGAVAVNTAVQAGQAVTFAETAAAGTTLGNYDSAYRCASVDAAGVEIAELEIGTAGSGDVVMPSNNVVCTVTNTRKTVQLTLQKQWVGADIGDSVIFHGMRTPFEG